MDIPMWIYAIVAGIVISALMALKTGKEERKVEHDSIEKEGEVYMERLQHEKELRKGERATDA